MGVNSLLLVEVNSLRSWTIVLGPCGIVQRFSALLPASLLALLPFLLPFYFVLVGVCRWQSSRLTFAIITCCICICRVRRLLLTLQVCILARGEGSARRPEGESHQIRI